MNGFDGRRRIDRADLVLGLAVALGCLVAGLVGAGYGIGTPRRMGAGFFPVALSAVGVALGVAIMARAVLAPQFAALPVDLRRILCVLAAFIVFAVAIEPAGLVLAVFATAIVAGAADPAMRLKESALLGAGLAAGMWLIFVALLGLTVPVLPRGW